MEDLCALNEVVDRVLSKYSGERQDLIPILQDIQEEVGYLPEQAMVRVALRLNIPPSSVYGVATFYSQFYLTRQGRHRIKVCQGTACHVKGAPRIMEAVRRHTGLVPGETSPDFKFSVERVACLGSCALAPVVVVDGKVHGRMTPSEAERMLGELD